MRFRLRIAFTAGVTLVCIGGAACSHSTEPTVNGPVIHLTAAQAAVLADKVALIGPVHPELSWLADSASLVLSSGAEADRIDVTTDLASGPFYAVGLRRALIGSGTSFATFNLIAFDDPSNPTNFIIIDGYQPGTGTTPPTSVTDTFGGSAMNGYLFHVVGTSVTSWRAQGGTGSFAGGSAAGACASFQAQNGITCARSSLQTSFDITTASPDRGSAGDPRHASLASTTVAGILLTFQ